MGQLILQGTGVTDSYISNADTSTNFSTEAVIATGKSTPVLRGLLKFDLSSIPSGATILDATLTLTYAADNSSNVRTLRVYRITRGMVITQVTWNQFSSGNNWGIAGVGDTTSDREAADIGNVSIPASPTLDTGVNITLTAAKIQEMISGGVFTNNGFLLQVDTENTDNINYHSTEASTSGFRPKLVVNYEVSSPSASVSSSSSASKSPSASVSPSSSISSSISRSVSPSTSQSPSASVSPSSSASPSPSAGYSIYTRQELSVLPTTDNDLTITYIDSEEDRVSEADGIRVGQVGTNEYMIHQFKTFVGTQVYGTIEFQGQSSLAPRYSTVYLQIYNQVSHAWETLTSNSEADEEIDFELLAFVSDLTNYKTPQNTISCRVYQLAL